MFNNLTVKTRLFLLIGIMSTLAISLSLMGLYGMKRANDGLQTVYTDRVVPLKDLKIIADMYAVNIVDTTHKVRNGNISWQESIKNVDDAEKTIKEKWDGYLATVLVAEEEKLVAEIKPLFASTQPKIDKLQAILKRNDNAAVTDFSINELYPAIDPISTKFSELVEVQLVVAKQEYEDATNRFRFMLIGSLVLLVLSIAISLAVGSIIVRRLLAELGGEPNYAVEIVRKIAVGQLTTNVIIQHGDTSSLLYSINKMRQTLADIIANTSSVMKDVSHGELGSQIQVEVEGDFIQLKQSINETIIQLRVTLFALNDVMYAIYNAEFSKVISGQVQGKFKETLDRAIQSQGALREMLTDIGQVMEHVAIGDINHRVTVQGRGELLTLKDNINNTLAALNSLNEIEHVVSALANGDLTKTITNQYPGIFGKVTTSLNNTVDNLKTLIGEIKTSSEVIASAANEISAGNNDLSHRTENQASSLQETAASMEELSTAVQQNTDNAKQANQLAEGASTTAKKGVQVVNDVVKTMATINESSHKIVDIITVIDDIAFQTNILALNAAVEAARAGDSGKGFAVVAVEVRNLAQRAANAAGEIKRLIDDSVESISNGSKQVEQAGKTMEDIVGAIQNVTVIMSDIAKASFEQNAGIEQVHQAITQMDEVTHQNAALVEEAAAAAESLSDQTRSLALEMANFKTVVIK